EDADSEGVEGKFYVWSPDEVLEVLGPEAAERFCYVYDVTESGNFEGHSILNLPKTIAKCAAAKGWDLDELERELAESRSKLLERRSTRIRPGKDDKVIVSWNGLMIHAMAKAAAAFDRADYRDAAIRAANFIRTQMTDSDGRLLHTWRHGTAKLSAYVDDYATLANALVTLYEATFDEQWIAWGVSLMDFVLDKFQSDNGTLYCTADDHEKLITRTVDMHDSSVPSGNGISATALVRLGRYCGRSDLLKAAHKIINAAAPIIEAAPSAAGQMMIAADMLIEPGYEIVICGGDDRTADDELLHTIRTRFLPHCSVLYRPATDIESAGPASHFFEARRNSNGEITTYICQNQTCEAPIIGIQAAIARIEELSSHQS
ncbi:MAG: thioredoxin domain-containing protein, partial [Planctomycetales bacterium]|nr:thioredoxin domain-containing protein [Planctomycetales bacterium]